MPVYKCSDGKYRIGKGKCVYKTKSKADRAYRACKLKRRLKQKRGTK